MRVTQEVLDARRHVAVLEDTASELRRIGLDSFELAEAIGSMKIDVENLAAAQKDAWEQNPLARLESITASYGGAPVSMELVALLQRDLDEAGLSDWRASIQDDSRIVVSKMLVPPQKIDVLFVRQSDPDLEGEQAARTDEAPDQVDVPQESEPPQTE